MKLVAKYPILYQSKQYEVGQALPASNTAMVEAWVAAGTAAWVEEKTASAPKAVPVAAEAGLAGESANGETPESLVGKVPKTATRSKGRKKSGG